MKKNLLWLVMATLVTTSLTCPPVAIGQLNRAGMNATRPDSPLADAPKPYWRVHTNPDSRSTTVQFFNKTDELIYEEALYGRYLHLNEQNAARLDQLLNRLTANNLVASELKTHDLLPERVFYKDRPKWLMPEAEPVSISPKKTSIHAEAISIAGTAKLLARLVNPSGHRVFIKIENQRGDTFYWDSVVQSEISRRFDLSALKDGFYTLRVNSYNNKDRYTQPFRVKAGQLILIE